MERRYQAGEHTVGVVSQVGRFSLDQLAQQYYMQIKYYFSCRLDSEVEAELLTRQTFRAAAEAVNHRRICRIDEFLLSVAADLLRKRWLEGGDARYRTIRSGRIGRSLPCSCAEELQDQAAEFYIKLRVLQSNPDATAEVSATIYQWIGKDPQRQAAYDRVRKVLYQKGGSQPATIHPINPSITGSRLATSGTAPDFDQPASLGWPDIVLLVFVFLLLLPMIYFLAVPVGQ